LTPSKSKIPLLKLLAGSICISFSPIFIKIANTDPDLAGFYRMLFVGGVSVSPVSAPSRDTEYPQTSNNFPHPQKSCCDPG
jgi:hypothetical protein